MIQNTEGSVVVSVEGHYNLLRCISASLFVTFKRKFMMSGRGKRRILAVKKMKTCSNKIHVESIRNNLWKASKKQSDSNKQEKKKANL